VQISSLYRITSHKQIVEVDDASTSTNKVSKQVLIFENELPDEATIEEFIKGTSAGIILLVDAFEKANYQAFDYFKGAEANLKVVKTIELNNYFALLCVPGDYLTFYLGQELTHHSKVFEIKVITLSDRAHRGIYKDESGPKATDMLTTYFKKIEKTAVVRNIIIQDDEEELSALIEESVAEKTDIIVTTGGTGVSRRDITVETVQKLIEKEIPGIMEMIRVKYGAKNPNALLSKGIAGTIKRTLVYTLPGSEKAVEEYLNEIFLTLEHLIYMIHEIDIH